MQFAYKCPVCRANNLLTRENAVCRRCKSDLSLVYRIKKKVLIKVLNVSENTKKNSHH